MPPNIHLTQLSTAPAKEIGRKVSTARRGKDREKQRQHRETTVPSPPNPSSLATTDGAIVPMTNPSSMYGGASMYGGGMYGGGMYGGGMYGMPPFGGGIPPPGPLSGLNQFLFGVQNVVFSLGQAVQIIGMNTQAIQHLLETASTMFDHALKTYTEMRMLEASVNESESEEDKKKKRRLRALRWMMVTVVTYAGYRVVKLALQRRRPRTTHINGTGSHNGALPPSLSYGGLHAQSNWDI